MDRNSKRNTKRFRFIFFSFLHIHFSGGKFILRWLPVESEKLEYTSGYSIRDGASGKGIY